MKKTLSVLLSILMVVGTVSCCFGVTAAAADEVIAFRYDALGFTEGEDGLAANIDFGKNIIRGFDVGVEDYGDYITAGKDGLYPQFETGSAIGTGDRVKVTTEQGAVVADYETVVYGDLDGDGCIDVLDLVLVERISGGSYVPVESDFADGGISYNAYIEAADVNGDGEIDVTDFSALVDAALGGAEIDQRRVEASWVENVHTEIEAQAFTGLEITPDLDVDLCGKLLEKDSDYEVSFSENIEIGEAYITVSAKKDSLYSGEKTFKFEIKSIIEIVCREIGTMLKECGIDDCISVSYNAENAAADVIFDGDALLALELNPYRDALTGVYSELMSLFGKIYAERKLTVGGVTVGENGVKNYAGINELKNELRNALRSFENAEENLVKSFDGVIASETVNENFKVNVKFNCSDADALYSGLAALDGFVVFGADELEPELTVIDVNIPESFARELAAEYEDIYGAVEGFGAMDVNTFIGKFAGLETSDITAENGGVINMFTDAFGKMNIFVTDILAGRDISISADGSEYINAYNGNAFNSENGSTAGIGSFIAALGELAELESVKASAFSDGRGDYCVYVKVGYADSEYVKYADSEYVKNYKLNLNVFGALVDELENTPCDYTALTNAINNANTVLSGGTAYTSASLVVVNEKLTAANGVPAGLLKGVNCENQKLIDDTAEELNLAVAALINKADYTKLNEAKSAAAVIKADGKDYTDDTMAVLDKALSDADELSDDLSFEYQQTVDNAANAINDAIAALKINADYTALDEAKEDAAAKKSDPKIYTDATLLVLETALNAAAEVPENLTSENQQLIDNAAAAINNAIAALEEKADYMQLDAAKQAAANVSFATYIVYTEESLAAFNTALENANALSDDLSVDYQQIIDDAAAALNDAITSLKIKADYTALNEAKAKAAEIKSNGKVYTTATMSVLDSALADAAEVPENLTSENQQLIDNAAAAINNAIAALKEKANYSVLESAVQLAAGIKTDGNDYFEDTMAVLDSALEAAGKISDDLSVDDQKMIDDAETAILNAIAALKIKADYTALENAKTAAAEIKANGKVYTTATMSVLDSALSAAEEVPAGLTIESQKTIDNAAAAINDAIAALVEYVDPSEVNNIAVKLANTSKYLYRVGNANAVALSYLFEAKGEVNSADVVLTVTTIEGTAACTYTANTTAWQNGTVKFSGEGVVKVSISHNKAAATELYLEVVNGKNFTSASGLNATSANAVLLSDITHTGSFSVSNGYALYGNGFTVNGSFHKNSSSLLCGLVTLDNGTLDNVVIRHAAYPEQNLYRDSASMDGAYYNYVVSAVYVSGNGGKIVNSFISGGRAAVYVVGSKVEITDSTLYGGAVANIHADGENTIILTNVTTVQEPMLACDGSRSVKGLGVVLGQYAMGTKIVLNGYLKQYNWITADDEQYIVDTQMMGSVLNAALGSDFARTVGGKKYANAGIVGMFEDALLITDNRTNTDVTYEYKQITVRVSIASMTGGSYNIVSGGDPLAEAPEYEASEQMLIAPTVKYSASQNVEMSGDSLNIPVAANVTKYGTEIPYEVYYNGQKVTGDSITVTNKGDYTLTYKYSDSMVYGADGVKTGESVDYSTDVTVKVTKAATKTITMTYDKTNAVYYWVKAGTAWDPDWSSAVPLLEGLVIKSEDEQGNVVEIFNGAGMGRIPDNLGLEITSISGFISGSTATQVSYNGKMYAYGSGKFDNNKTAHNITVKYKYTDEYNKEHTLSVTWNMTASTTGTEVSESNFKGTPGTQKYVALFEACGGYCATGFAAVTSGTNITLPAATREGYKFNGWYTAETGGTKLGDAGATYKMSAADVTFYAHWIAPRTLTFDACGGTYSVTAATYYNGDTVTLAKPEYPGYYFMGWCESGDGSGERLFNRFTMPDNDVTLYAIWSETPPAEFTVKFNVNGGPGSVAQMIAKESEALELPAAPAREGHTFTGWFTDASGGERIGGAGDEVKFTESTELFAQWSVNSYKVTTSEDNSTLTLTANGQSVASGDSVAYGTVISIVLYHAGTGSRTFTVNGTTYYSDEACLNATTSMEPGTYYIRMPANDITLSASSSGCFATGTLITLADGSQKAIEDITFGDKILAWDFFTGTYVEKEISVLVYHGDDTYAVANTVYSDGTVLRTIAEHGVFDYDLNKFVYITAANCTDYIGHRFVKYNGNGSYDIVTMTDAYATTEVTGAYSISSAGTSNAIAEGLLTVAPPEDFYNWIEMDGKLHYDVEQFNADVEKYGLYDYEVFSDYVTYEQFVAFNGAYLRIPVEKGLFTFDYIIELINLYSQWMPE